MPINYKSYPSNWLSEIRPAVLQRAKNCCECCGVANYTEGYRNATTGEITQDETDYEQRKMKIVLTVAHLNQNVADNRLENLAALCQRCNLNYDRNDNTYRKRFGKDYKNCKNAETES